MRKQDLHALKKKKELQKERPINSQFYLLENFFLRYCLQTHMYTQCITKPNGGWRKKGRETEKDATSLLTVPCICLFTFHSRKAEQFFSPFLSKLFI